MEIKKPKFYDKCKIRQSICKKKGNVILLHGFSSFKFTQNRIAKKFQENGFDTYQCNFRGHGNRLFDGKKTDWGLDVEETSDLVNYINDKDPDNQISIVGQSMGGLIGLSTANKNEHIDKVFVIGAGNNNDVDVSMSSKILYAMTTGKNINNLEDISTLYVDKYLPEKTNQCKQKNKDKYFLIHSKIDNLLTFDHFLKNKKQLCIPDENVLVLNRDSNINFGGLFKHMLHATRIHKKETIDFIIRKMTLK